MPSLSNDALARRVAAAVDQDRLWRRHMEMAEIGAIPGNGVNRQCLSPEDIRARALLIRWAGARGFEIAVDDVANLFVRRAGADPDAAPVVTGSHLDSQPQGGRFDGAFGVLAGFEALEALEDAGVTTRRPIEVVSWTNEEGGRYAPGTMGSAVFTGASRLEDWLDKTDAAGIRLGDALAETLAAAPGVARRPFGFPIAAYVEGHIEQGPRLEDTGNQVGVVSGIQGAPWYVVEVLGEPGHAGTAPLRGRKDALREAVALIAALQEMMLDVADTVRFTVGRLDVEPNSPNTVPAKVTFSIDFRHPDEAVLRRLGGWIEPVCRRAARACSVAVTETFHRPPCAFSERVVDTIGAAATALEVPHLVMPSGAFHDAEFLNDVCPTGMIFVPCERGISHNPAENAKPEDLAAGTRVLAAALIELANA